MPGDYHGGHFSAWVEFVTTYEGNGVKHIAVSPPNLASSPTCMRVSTRMEAMLGQEHLQGSVCAAASDACIQQQARGSAMDNMLHDMLWSNSGHGARSSAVPRCWVVCCIKCRQKCWTMVAEGGLDRMSDMCQARIHDRSYTAAIVTTLVLCVLHVVMVGSHICPRLCV